jgi:RND family efflux transporter MFP subunit
MRQSAKRQRTWICCGSLFAFCILVGCQPTTVERPAAAIPSVTVSKPAQSAIIEWAEFTGRLEATQSVEIRSRVGGYLESAHFQEGQDVEQGALLFIVDPKPFAAELAQASASLEEAKAQLVRTQAQAEQATAGLATANSQLELAKAGFDRAQVLGNALSQAERDTFRNEFQKATAAVDSMQAGIALANADIARAAAAVATAEAAVRNAELNLEYTNVRAPISGRIGRILVTEGNLISGGSEQATLLTTIVAADPIYFVFDASEQQILQFQRRLAERGGQAVRDSKPPVYLGLADEPGFPRPGYIDFVDNRLDTGTATKLIRAIFENTDGLLTPGMFGRLRLAASEEYTGLLLPDEAIGVDQAEKYVYVVEQDNKVRRQSVVTGPIAKGLRVIRSGISAEDQVIVSGLQRARPGISVAPQISPVVVRDTTTLNGGPADSGLDSAAPPTGEAR